MDEVTVIRHRVLVGGVSRRAVALELGVSRNTVRRYVEGAPAEVRKRVPRSRPALDKVRPRMDELLASSAGWTAGKQRLSATQLHRMLAREGIAVGVSLVKQYVHEWKRQRAEVFVPLVYQPGDLGEVDFFEVLVELCGKRVKAWMFLLRAMASGRDFAWLFPRQDQTCFLEVRVPAMPIAHSGRCRSPVPAKAITRGVTPLGRGLLRRLLRLRQVALHLPDGLAGELHTVGVVDESVAHGVGDRLVADD